ncbi:NADP-dependent oxidoreductase domain-containing protein [Mrakia frigida]|uniref:NADP-dependent oxidoreductase domain-containing protein n=1 Tax=Mrakia frigida TaxID=29902 RepID=UPI003FCC064F
MIKSKEGIPSYIHTEESIRACIKASFEALRVDSVPLWYLHGPDRSTPWAETFGATDKLFKEGKFERLGISNYKASEVEEILSLCDEKGWCKPTVYQGPYNAIQRQIEPELIPVMRKWGMSLIAFNPLLGGFLTSLKTADSQAEAGSRFDPNGGVGKLYRGRYWKDEYFAASAKLDEAAKLASTTMPALVLRWIQHHSVLDPTLGDRVLIGASNHTQLDDNLTGLEGGPLDASIVALIDEAAKLVKDSSPPYHH